MSHRRSNPEGGGENTEQLEARGDNAVRDDGAVRYVPLGSPGQS